MDFTSDKYTATMAIKKIKMLGAVLEQLAKKALLIWPIWDSFEVNWLDWQCCFAGSFKMAPRILIFSIVQGAEYLSYVKSIATFALTFFGYIISVFASVRRTCLFHNVERVFIHAVLVQGCRNWRIPVSPCLPKFLEDQLTLFKPGRAEYAHQLLMERPSCFTFWQLTKRWGALVSQTLILNIQLKFLHH